MKSPRGVKSHPCPQCGKMRHFKTRSYYRSAVRENTICKSCTQLNSREANIKRGKDRWANMSEEERQRIRKRYVQGQKKRWQSLSEEEREKVRERGRKGLRIAHLKMWNPKNKAKWIANLKKSFEKHRGDKHWVYRPETYLKIVESNKKYCGENHWFHRPEVRKRWQAAMRKRYPQKKLKFSKTSEYI